MNVFWRVVSAHLSLLFHAPLVISLIDLIFDCFKVSRKIMTQPQFFCLTHSQTLEEKTNTISSCWPAITLFNFMLNWRPSSCSGSVHRRWKKMFACGAVRSALRFKPTLHLGQNTAVWYVRHLIAERFFIRVGHKPSRAHDTKYKLKIQMFYLQRPSAGTIRFLWDVNSPLYFIPQ